MSGIGYAQPTPPKIFRKDAYFEKTGYEPHLGQRLVHYQPTRHRVLCNGRRWGKGATLSTLVATPQGWTTVGKLQVGDEVFGADGSVITILAAIDPYEADTWRITFDDGAYLDVDSPHRWLVDHRQSRTRGYPAKVMTTQEMVDHPRTEDLSIRVAQALQLPRVNLPLDPYLLGRWLGDGSSHFPRITSLPADSEPMTRRGCLPSKVWAGEARHYRMPKGSRAKLTELGVMLNKHIPEQYLRTSELQRRQLLAGLIDSDGAREGNRIRFSQSDEALFKQVQELVLSLGYKVKISSRVAKLYGVDKKVSRRLTFYPAVGDYVAEVDRKKSDGAKAFRGVAKDHRRIRSIRPTGLREMVRCFTVSSEDHLWLLGEAMVPTHNTLVGGKECEAAAFVKNFLGAPQMGWIIGPEYSDCEKEFRVLYDTFKKLGIDTVSNKFSNNIENGNMRIQTKWGFDIQCRSAKHPESLVGEGLDFVLLVEAGRHKRKMWAEYVRPALSDKRGWSLTSGVPEGSAEDSLLYSLYMRGQDPTKKSWWSIRMPSWTNPVVFPGGRQDPEILEAEDDLTDDEFDRQYGAKFVERVGRVMTEWDDSIHLKPLVYDRNLPLFAAVDFGYTNDWVWLWIQLDPWRNVYVIGEERFQYRDTEDIARNEFLNHPLLSKLMTIYCDPAAASDIAQLRRVLGKDCSNKTGGDIDTRIKLMRSALKPRPFHLPDGHPEKQPKLFVDPSCKALAWEMRQGYRWPEIRSARFGEGRNASEIPLDKNNHGPEALGRFFKGHMEAISPLGSGTKIKRVPMRGGARIGRR